MEKLTFEICISTMNDHIPTWVDGCFEHNILIINQTNNDQNYLINKNVRVICTRERGLSKSRNMAIENSLADFLIISDNDNDFNLQSTIELICSIHKEQNAVYIMNDQKKLFHQWDHKILNSRDIMRIASWQMILNRKFLNNKKIRFDENFGLGCDYNHGEENILLSDILQADGRIIATGLSGVMHPDLGTVSSLI